jgi:probable F420-dependent oxidoreductase
MRFGVILHNYGPGAGLAGMVSTAAAAEELGFDSVWATDHVLLPLGDAPRFEHIFEALTTLTYLAGRSERLRLGISSLVLPLRNPILVAKQMATLDALSGGRAMLCVGAGWSVGEFANLGQRFDDRGKRLDEAIQLLRALWAGGKGHAKSFQGRYYQFEDAAFSPPCIQPGGPPIWIGGHSNAALRRAARLGDGWHPSGPDLEMFRQRLARLQELAGDRSLTISMRIHISALAGEQATPGPDWRAAILASLGAYAEAGLTYPVINFDAKTQSQREELMAAFAREIMPRFATEAP